MQCRREPAEKEEEAVFISVVSTNEDPPNAHQAQEEEEEAVFISVVNTNEDPRRRRWWSLLVKIEGDPLNTQHAQHRSVQATDR